MKLDAVVEKLFFMPFHPIVYKLLHQSPEEILNN